MGHDQLCKRLCVFLTVTLVILLSPAEGKGFGSRGGGGFKGGSKGPGTFSSGSGFSGSGGSGMMNKPRTGGGFQRNAMSFAAGAAGGVAAYSIMRGMSGSYHRREGYYGPNYGNGDMCENNENLNGTVFGKFRCPLYGFPTDARYCCGEYGKQFCCRRESNSRYLRNSAHFGWIVLIIVILLVCIFLWARHRRQQQKEMIMVPTEPPMNQSVPPFYNPPPPPMGYPAPPGSNPYAAPSQNYAGNFNPYAQPTQMPYSSNPQPYNPY